MALPNVIYRLVTDETFRNQLLDNPGAALAAAQLDLNPEELEAFNTISSTWLSMSSQPKTSLTQSDGGWYACQFKNFCPTLPETSTAV